MPRSPRDAAGSLVPPLTKPGYSGAVSGVDCAVVVGSPHPNRTKEAALWPLHDRSPQGQVDGGKGVRVRDFGAVWIEVSHPLNDADSIQSSEGQQVHSLINRSKLTRAVDLDVLDSVGGVVRDLQLVVVPAVRERLLLPLPVLALRVPELAMDFWSAHTKSHWPYALPRVDVNRWHEHRLRLGAAPIRLISLLLRWGWPRRTRSRSQSLGASIDRGRALP